MSVPIHGVSMVQWMLRKIVIWVVLGVIAALAILYLWMWIAIWAGWDKH